MLRDFSSGLRGISRWRCKA